MSSALRTESISISNSLVIPIYKSEHDIPSLLKALAGLHADLAGDLEVVFVVDGSPDQSFPILRDVLGSQPFSSQLVLLNRNFGSFAAIRRGLEVAHGEHLAVMAADLQEPIELIKEFFDDLHTGEHDVVVGVRASREDTLLVRLTSHLFWSTFRRLVMPEMPKGGIDVFGCTAKFRDDLVCLGESNSSLVGQLLWLGGRRKEIPYKRRAREQGRSAWTYTRRFKYMLDSILAFSDLPIFLLLWIGTCGILGSLGIGLAVLVAWALGMITVAGYTPVILLLAVVGSMLMFGQGIIGSYVWRANENSKARPLSIVQSRHEFKPSGSSSNIQSSFKTEIKCPASLAESD